MRALVQRCLRASVEVDGVVVGEIGEGLLVLVGVTHTDDDAVAANLARKVHELRILRGESSLLDAVAPQALVVSQFTLYADTKRGRRPSWGAAAPGATAEPLVSLFVGELARRGVQVATGRFGADMRVESVNDGPITVMLEI